MPNRFHARAAVLVATALLVLQPLAARAAASCNFVSGSVGVTMDGTAATLDVSGGAIRLNGSQCGTATVPTANIVAISGTGGTLTIDMTGARFEPGLDVETDGAAEIEFVLNSSGIGLHIKGRDDATDIDQIWRAPTGGLHLNGDNDQDFAFNQLPASLRIDGQGGADLIDLSLGNGNGNPQIAGVINGGDGDDVLHGAGASDSIDGGPGHDQIADGFANDATVNGGDGDDTFLQGRTFIEATFSTNVAIPDGGSATSAINVNGALFADDLNVRVNVSHAQTEDLTITLERGLDTATLADGVSGAGFVGTVFDDAAASVPPASGTHTGRFRPADPLADIASSGVSGSWVLEVTDNDPDGVTGTIRTWAIELVGSMSTGGFGSNSRNGSDDVDGGSGTDRLSYASRLHTVTVAGATATSGTAGEELESDDYSNVEIVAGGLAGDVFNGSDENDSFEGGPGDDRFLGSAGDDQLDCGDFFDTDILDFRAETSGVVVDLEASTATGDSIGSDGAKNCDSVLGTDLADEIDGHAGANVISDGAGEDVVDARDGEDEIIVGDGADQVTAGAGNDTVVASSDGDADTFDAGDGVDSVQYSSADPFAVRIGDELANDGPAGEGDLIGGSFENVTAAGGSATIIGNSSDNTITGGESGDFIDGGLGDDTLDGGDGDDTVSFQTATSGATINIATGSSSGGAGLDSFSSFATVIATAFDDVIAGSGLADRVRPGYGDDTVDSAGGNDTLIAEAGADGADAWTAGTGTDTADYSLRTSSVTIAMDGLANDGADGEGDNIQLDVETVVGGQAGDSITGGAEVNTFRGGPGNDTLLGRGGADVLLGEAGGDTVLGSSGNDQLSGGDGNDVVNGGDGDDTIHGDANDDTMIGGSGDDDEFGDAGNDHFRQGDVASTNGSDLMIGGDGIDTASYNGRSAGVSVRIDGVYNDGQSYELDNVSTDVENLEGTASADRLTGSSSANTLRGMSGNDVLDGRTGNDQLFGDAGSDTMDAASTNDGNDLFFGGSGIDAANYRLRTGALRIDLDNVADDGLTGELDNIRGDVENVFGGSGNDRITGSSLPNRVLGGSGADVIVLGGGSDYADAGPHNDVVYARDGVRDTVFGGTGTDRLQRDAIDSVSGVEAFF